MDGTASREEKAPPPTGADDGAYYSEAPVEAPDQRQKHHVLPPLPAGVPSDTAVKVEGAGEEEDDEQVERFFALLAKIRALRALYGAAFAGGGGGGAERGESLGGAAGRVRKRAREAEPAWRPAFRMEDFDTEEQRAGKKEKKVRFVAGARRPAGTSTTGAVADGDEDDGEVVEQQGV